MSTNVVFDGNKQQLIQLVPTLTTPAAGADFTYTIPSTPHAAYSLEAISLTLTTSATVANRLVRFKVTRSSTIISAFAAPAVTAASSTLTVFFQKVGASNTQSTSSTIAILPDLPPLLPGDILATFTLNLQAGDTLTVPVAWFVPVSL